MLARYAIHDRYILEELRRAYVSSDGPGRIRLLRRLYRGITGYRRGEGRVPFEIARLAVEDPSVEVRQWIARHGKYLDYSNDYPADENLEDRLKNDPDPFVRACLRENPTAFGLLVDWTEYFNDATHLERLALVRNPEVGEELIQKVFDPQDKELGTSLEERKELILAFLTNKEALARTERLATDRVTASDDIQMDAAIMAKYGAEEFLKKLWKLASKWRETGIQAASYLALPGDDKTKAAIYRTCDEPVLRRMILNNCSPKDVETIELGVKDTEDLCRYIAESLAKQTQKLEPPKDPEELFATTGNFLEAKIDFIGKKLLSFEEHAKSIIKAFAIVAAMWVGWKLLIWLLG